MPPLERFPRLFSGGRCSVQQGNTGFYTGKVDGVFGEVTDGAVKEYQTRFKLAVDGMVGPKTKASIMRPENDGIAHVGIVGGETMLKLPTDGSPVTYWIGPEPGYLDRGALCAGVQQAFEAWAAAGSERPVTFSAVDDEEGAMISISFGLDAGIVEDADDNYAPRSDGAGGKLADATPDGVIFDCAERWCTSLSGSISTILTVLSWICTGIYICRALPSPVSA